MTTLAAEQGAGVSRRVAAGRIVEAGFLVSALIAVPYVTSSFVFVQIVIQSLWLGTIAASLTFLIRYAGMISLAQTGLYGVAGYVTANLSVKQGLNAWAAAGVGVLGAILLAVVVALLAARARGVYFLMLTLAVGVFLYYFALQYRPFTFGFGGINGVPVPRLGPVSLSSPVNFYWFSLGVSLLSLLSLRAFAASPLGLALQADRDCPERADALGMNPTLVRIVGFTAAGAVAAAGGVLSVWFNGQISPGSLDITRTIDVLIVAVLGGVLRLEGAWLGALLFTVLSVYVSDVTDHYNTVIGIVFIVVVLVSPNGVPGLISSAVNPFRRIWSSAAPRRAVAPLNEEEN